VTPTTLPSTLPLGLSSVTISVRMVSHYTGQYIIDDEDDVRVDRSDTQNVTVMCLQPVELCKGACSPAGQN
jgi:hypothetical protein